MRSNKVFTSPNGYTVYTCACHCDGFVKVREGKWSMLTNTSAGYYIINHGPEDANSGLRYTGFDEGYDETELNPPSLKNLAFQSEDLSLWEAMERLENTEFINNLPPPPNPWDDDKTPVQHPYDWDDDEVTPST